jgi:tetratricopeptide (TPR) repeat protein
VVPELSVLEKALAKGDLAGQLQPLDTVVKALRQARARSLQDLDMDTRGRLITTLSRIARQPKPPTTRESVEVSNTSTDDPTEPLAAAEAAATDAPSDAPQSSSEACDVSEASEVSNTSTADGVSAAADAAGAEAETSASGAATEPAAPGSPEVSNTSSTSSYEEVLFRVGLAWSAVGEADRAEAAFGAAGRRPSADELRAPEAEHPPPGVPPSRGERGAPRAERPSRGARPDRPPRVERRGAPVRGGPVEIPSELSGDWKAQATFLESRGRTRDAARLHDRNGSHAEAARLFEAGADLRSALRSALAGKDLPMARRLAEALPPGEAQTLLEKAEAWELLMELHVRSGRFEEVAKLYERARQFDQAGLAWERAGKLSAARKAYERAHDAGSIDRVRTLEVDRLVERGDRLGAALLLVQARRREEAAKLLEPLPPPKAFRFLQQLELHAEARALGERELQKATEESKSMARARWLELLERPAEAADAWEAAGRKDKAFPLLEKAGQFGRGARIAEELGNRNEAIRLYRRAGEDADADRLEALPPVPATEAPPPPPPDSDEVLGEGSGDSPHP